MPYSRPQPIDKATIYQEWKHLIPGALALALNAGFINSVVLGFFDTPVSHMSGAVSQLGIHIAGRQTLESIEAILIIVGFFFGSLIAGAVIGAFKLMPGRRYGGLMILQGVLLLLATVFLLQKSAAGLVLAALACGVQNGMSSSYCGLATRTTHVTGTVTDLGVLIGQWIRHGEVKTWKVYYFFGLIFAFGLGGVTGAFFNIAYGPVCLFLPSFATLFAGIAFYAVMQREYSLDESRKDEKMALAD
ncbi:DUF1275 domain-containing protein [bacterium]|nr:MAG: DUF1275 domain-containing protein [bacterium]